MARRATFRLTAPVVPEHSLQKQVADALRLEIAPAGKLSAHGAMWFSVDHANFAGEVPGLRLTRGIVAGLPDMFVLHRGKAHLIELKGAYGMLSDAQKSVLAAATLAGVPVAVVDNLPDVLRALDAWGIPRARRVNLPLTEALT